MSNSNADNAKPAPAPAVAAKSRVRGDRRAAGTAPARMNGITITRWSLGTSLTLAAAVFGGAFGFLWDRIAGVEAEVRDLRTELHTEINGLRQELRADMRGEIAVLREEVRADIGDLREEVRADIGDLREEVRQLAAIIRARDAASQ